MINNPLSGLGLGLQPPLNQPVEMTDDVANEFEEPQQMNTS
jgi:hypothetical protein